MDPTPLFGDSVHVLSILRSIASDISFALIAGALLARYWLAKSSPLKIHNVYSYASSGVYTFAHLVLPWFLAASMSGSNSFHDNLALMPSILTSTQQGRIWAASSVAILLLVAGTITERYRPRIAYVLQIGSVYAIAVCKSASSHAGDDGLVSRLAILQAIHILSTALWSGSVIVSGLIVLPRIVNSLPPPQLQHYVVNLSRCATYAVIAVITTGVYTGNRELNGPLTGLWTSTWGSILLTKIVLVLVAFFCGAVNRLYCIGDQSRPIRQLCLRRVMRVEAWTMVAVLCLSGLLGNTSPLMPT